MKIFALLLALVAVAQSKKFEKPAFTRALKVRGGGELGPLDGELAMQLSKTVATAYVAGSASKYIASQTGGSSTQLADFVTTDLWQQHALCTAISSALYGLGATGFSDLKTLAAISAAALLLRFDSSGFSIDTVKDNKVQTVVALALLFIAYVK